MTENKTKLLHKGVFLDLDSVNTGDLDLSCLKNSLADWQFNPTTNPDDVIKSIRGASVVVSNKVLLDSHILDNASDLKLICIAATGINNVHIQAAQKHHIAVCNVTAYATSSVVQHVFRLILALTGQLWDNARAVTEGQWSKSPFFCLLDYPPLELTGKTIGIVGYGELGHAVARLAQQFGMKVLIAKRDRQDKRPGRLSLAELLPQVDVLSLHCPLTGDNNNLIDRQELSLLPAHAVLINTARGGLVNETALLDALQNRQIAGAGLDVLAQEPPSPDYPLLNTGLSNLIITPHIAWASQQSRQRLLNEVAANITAFKNGEQKNRIV
ncbi:MAG: D-2-hydroxyacid dehydrogenase [Gammaproteobacteria bacterium]|nr:D-2-hydroxyacid dehydrogenase [Gammaproteobacteria bacterium]